MYLAPAGRINYLTVCFSENGVISHAKTAQLQGCSQDILKGGSNSSVELEKLLGDFQYSTELTLSKLLY